MSSLTKEREQFLLDSAEIGLFEVALTPCGHTELLSLIEEKLVVSNLDKEDDVISETEQIKVSWLDPYESAWPLSAYRYIHGKDDKFPETSATKLAEKLFIIAKKVEVENNK